MHSNAAASKRQLDTNEIRSAAIGRWLEILPRAGIPADALDRRHHPCPKCGGTDRFSLVDEDAGAVLCRKCFSKDNGDGFAAVQWSLGVSFPEALAFVADVLGIAASGMAPKLDPIAAVESAKRIPRGWLAKYGATVVNDAVVVPMFDPNGKRCSEQTLDTTSKGLYSKSKPVGLFLPHVDGKPHKPQPGDTWLIVEGVKDAAALASLGYNAAGLPSSKLPAKFLPMFRGVNVVLVPDRDKAGDEGSAESAALLHGTAASVRVVALPAPWTETDGDGVREVLKSKDGESLLRSVLDFEHFENKIADFEPLRPLADEPPQFRVSWMPPVLAQFVSALSESTQTAPDLAALLVLAVVATTIQKRVICVVNDSWPEQPSLMVLPVADPGERKSALFAHATKPLRDFENIENQNRARDIRERAQERRILEARIKKLEDRAAKEDNAVERRRLIAEATEANDELAQIPPIPQLQLIADDTTSERLVQIMGEQDGRIAVMSAEGGIFDTIRGRYSNGVGNFDVYLKGHAGDDIRTDRMSRSSESIRSPAITMAIAVQRDVMRGNAGDAAFRGRGLLARFLYAIPASPLGRRSIDCRPIPEHIAEAYNAMVQTLCAMRPEYDAAGEPILRILRISPKSTNLLNTFRSEIELQLGMGGELYPIQGWAGKLPGLVVRLATIMHAAEHANEFCWWDEPISEATMRNAIEIGKYAIPHAQLAMAMMNDASDLQLATEIVAWIKRHELKTFDRRDLHQHKKNDSRIKSPEDLDAPLARMVEHGYLRSIPEPKSGPGRKPSPAFEVNPAVFQKLTAEIGSQYSQNAPERRKRVTV